MLFRPTVRRILQSLLAGSKSLTDLSEETRLTKQALQRHLKDLERIGVIDRAYRPIGASREVVYHHAGCSLRLEIRPPGTADPLSGTVLSWATAGHEDPAFPLTAQIPRPEHRNEVVLVLRRLKRALAEDFGSLFIVVFGSFVRGEATRKSDIDLMFVLPGEDARLRERTEDAIADLQSDVEHAIQPFFATREAFLAGKKRMPAAAAEEGMVVHAPAEERELWSLMKRYRTISI